MGHEPEEGGRCWGVGGGALAPSPAPPTPRPGPPGPHLLPELARCSGRERCRGARGCPRSPPWGWMRGPTLRTGEAARPERRAWPAPRPPSQEPASSTPDSGAAPRGARHGAWGQRDGDRAPEHVPDTVPDGPWLAGARRASICRPQRAAAVRRPGSWHSQSPFMSWKLETCFLPKAPGGDGGGVWASPPLRPPGASHGHRRLGPDTAAARPSCFLVRVAMRVARGLGFPMSTASRKWPLGGGALGVLVGGRPGGRLGRGWRWRPRSPAERLGVQRWERTWPTAPTP